MLQDNVDEKRSKTGAEQFFRFEKQIDNLDKQLRNFTNAACQLGGSVRILSSVLKLRERLKRILFLFRENAANLYPGEITRRRLEVPSDSITHQQRRTTRRGQRTPAVKHTTEDDLEPDTLPTQFESLAKDFETFFNCLSDFPEFTDEAVNRSVRGFEGDLKYLASCLADYKGQFRSQAVRRYVHDLTMEIGSHIDNFAGTLSMLTEISVPPIKFHQQHTASNLLNLSAVATFFSAVTAATLQFSHQTTTNLLADCVNAFWFSSLVLSIAAAVNSLLGLTWKQAMYRSPGHRVPWWVLVWIKRGPLVLLVVSVVCFSVGLLLFTYSSRQGPVTAVTITVLTAITSTGLAAVSIWFATERWIFIQHKGQKWLWEVTSEAVNGMANTTIGRASRAFMRWCSSWIFKSKQPKEILPISQPHCPASPKSLTSSTRGVLDEPMEIRRADTRQRFVNAFRSVIKLQATGRPVPPRRNSSIDTSIGSQSDTWTLSGERRTKAIDKLKALETLQEITAHRALVRQLEFSPNGRYFATSSRDKMAAIFRAGDTIPLRVLVQTRGSISQVAWSPNGGMLLTRLTRTVKVWSKDGVCKKTVERQNTIQSIVWLSTGDAFLSVEGSDVVKLDLDGNVSDVYYLGQVRLTNVAATPDCSRLVGVGLTITSSSGPQPSYVKVEKRIIVYNMLTRRRESQAPFANDVRDISVARKSSAVLLSPENAAPQLWKLEIVRDRDQVGHPELTTQLDWKHTFALDDAIDIAGPSQFGGQDDQFVLCAGKAGDVFIWDTETAILLHSIRTQNTSGVKVLTCIGWNYATDDPMMFASGFQDGTVRIYSTAPLDERPDDESYSERYSTEGEATNPSIHSGT